MASFYVEAMVIGYHVYQDIWTAVVGEEFPQLVTPSLLALSLTRHALYSFFQV